MRRQLSLVPSESPSAAPGGIDDSRCATYVRRLATVFVTGEIDIATAPQLGAVLRRALFDAEELGVDVSGVAFFGVSGVNALASALATAERAGRRLHVRGAHGTTRRLFEITGFGHLLVDGEVTRRELGAAGEEVVTEGLQPGGSGEPEMTVPVGAT